MSGQVLLFVPLDDRPVTMDFVVDLARAAGVEVRVPDRSMLGDRNRAGDVDRVWDWLDREVAAGGATAMIASVEMLCFGGLVAARKSEAEFEAIAPRLLRLREVASHVPTYVSAVIPRTLIFSAEKDVPSRKRHMQLNTDLIEAAARGLFRYVLIGQDDTASQSQSQADRKVLENHAQTISASSVLVTTGADELNVRLLARWLNDLTGHSPAVRVLFSYPESAGHVPLYEATPLTQTVGEHLRSAGCTITEGQADILWWVHNFKDRQSEARDQTAALDVEKLDAILKQIYQAGRRDEVVALADVRYANGADRALMQRLLREPRFAGIVAYAGWNTCSNSLGTAIAQAVVVHQLRANTLPGSDRIFRPVLFGRILDDWGYQALVRPQLARWLEDQGGIPTELGTNEGTVETLALQGLRGDALPLLQASFPHHPITINRVAFPWHRLFEIHIDLEIANAARGRPIVVEEYDPVWPSLYEADRSAIVSALGPLVRGIEHVGSTSVPGLAAKPTIDILLGVGIEDLDKIVEPLVAIGYEYNPDWEISMPQRRFLRRLKPDNTHTHHLHVVPHGGEFWTRHVRFRDYLRTHPEKAREYGELKVRIAREHRTSIDYTFAKTEFIRSVEALTGVEYREKRARARTP